MGRQKKDNSHPFWGRIRGTVHVTWEAWALAGQDLHLLSERLIYALGASDKSVRGRSRTRLAELFAAFVSPASEMSHFCEQLGRAERVTQVIRWGKREGLTSCTKEAVQTGGELCAPRMHLNLEIRAGQCWTPLGCSYNDLFKLSEQQRHDFIRTHSVDLRQDFSLNAPKIRCDHQSTCLKEQNKARRPESGLAPLAPSVQTETSNI